MLERLCCLSLSCRGFFGSFRSFIELDCLDSYAVRRSCSNSASRTVTLPDSAFFIVSHPPNSWKQRKPYRQPGPVHEFSASDLPCRLQFHTEMPEVTIQPARYKPPN